jgi:aminoglycoside/choline kinase family phosphotransferase
MTAVASEEMALGWAYTRWAFSRCILISDAPWGKVFRLYGHGGAAYLKAVPQLRRGEVDLTSLLSGMFPRNIPPVLAASPSEGLLLMADHGGEAMLELAHIHRRAVLQCYARIQAEIQLRSSSLLNSILNVEALDLPCRLHDFLKQEGAGLLSRRDSDHAMSTFQKVSNKLRSSLTTAGQLPLVLEHGDLHAENIAVQTDGTPVLMDWSDAVVGPLGMSLGFLFGGCANLARHSHSEEGGLTLYIETLVRNGVGSYGPLSDLHHGAIAGVVHTICQVSSLVGADARFQSFGSQLIMRGMADLEESMELM